MDPPNVLWFSGTFAISFGVYAMLDTIPDDQNSLWILVAAVAFFVAFGLAAWALLQRYWWVPGGLAATLAVLTFPAVAVGFLELIDVWPDDPFLEPFDDFTGSFLAVALATAVVGLAAFAVTGFPFLLAVVIAAILIGSQLLVPGFAEGLSTDDRATMGLVIGALLAIGGVFLDAFGRRRDAFWFHVLGFFSVAAGLVNYTLGSGDHDRGWVPMLVIGLLMLIAAGPIRRATWAVYGVLGYYAGLLHYLITGLDEDRWPFALLLLAVGLSIFATGMLMHRYGQPLAARFVRRPPPTLGP
jgi:hypothetical protein